MDITEREIRANITARAHRLFDHDKRTVLIEELEVDKGRARIDMALIGSHLIGIEIKSPQDNLSRLASQSAAFSRYFEYVILVADHRLVAGAKEIIPHWWGIASIQMVEGRVRFRQTRRATYNPSLDIDALVELLWKEELLVLTKQLLGITPPSRDVKKNLRERLVNAVPLDIIQRKVIDLMSKRAEWRTMPLGTT